MLFWLKPLPPIGLKKWGSVEHRGLKELLALPHGRGKERLKFETACDMILLLFYYPDEEMVRVFKVVASSLVDVWPRF